MSNIDLTRLITAESKEARARADKYAALAALRWQHETGGITLPDGTNVITTREAQAQIAATAYSIGAGLVSGATESKFASGWQVLSAAQMTSLAKAVANHVKWCFTAERTVAALMDAETGELETFQILPHFQAAYLALAE